tara:strand:- start:21172 stop:21867 length:696 start_codon:yes stop_codon:yes gene_type:complete
MTGEQFSLAFPQPILPLDSLFFGEQGETSLRILRRWREWPKPYVGLIGSERSGVTTVLKSWSKDVGGRYLTPADWQELDSADVSKLLSEPLAIDDADTLSAPNALLTLMNLAAEKSTPLLLGGHRDTAYWHQSPPDLVSRLTAMTTVTLPKLTDDDIFRKRLKAACLKRHIRIPAETMSFVEPRLERSYQAIEAFANALDQAMNETSRPPTIPLARDVLNGFAEVTDSGEF